jgi:hypothetical protein
METHWTEAQAWLRGEWEPTAGRPYWLILRGREVVGAPMMIHVAWAGNLTSAEINVGEDGFDFPHGRGLIEVQVSTKFLIAAVGIDGAAMGKPFETMVFGGPMAQYQRRYSTWAAAEKGHRQTLVRAKRLVGVER